MAAAYKLKRSGTQFMWNLQAGNGETILTSERYTTKSSAEGGINSCRVNSGRAERYERRQSVAHQPYFVLKAANGEVIGTSEMYSSATARDAGIAACMKAGPNAPTIDLT